MQADLKKIKKLIKLMRTEGVLALKQGEIELSLSPAALFPKDRQDSESTENATQGTPYTEDDLINWSNINANIEASQ